VDLYSSPHRETKTSGFTGWRAYSEADFLTRASGSDFSSGFLAKTAPNVANDLSQRKDFARVSVGERLWNDVEARSLFCVTNDATDNGGNAVFL
jgi:hypothetical protein